MTKPEEREAIQDSAEARELEAQGWRYFCTYQDIDKKSPTYGKRIDVYRRKETTMQNTETMTREQLEAELATLRTTATLTDAQLTRMNALMGALDETNAEE